MLAALGYLADAWILLMYWWLARTGRSAPFNLANAVGCIPLLIAEYEGGLWQVMVLTGTFGALGWYGIWKGRG